MTDPTLDIPIDFDPLPEALNKSIVRKRVGQRIGSLNVGT